MHFRHLKAPEKGESFTLRPLFIATAYFRRAFSRSFLVIFATVAALLWMSSWAHSQENSPDSAPELDMLLSKKQYPQLEQALAVQGSELTPQTRAYFTGVMANRSNQVQKSLGLLEPLIPALLIND